MLLIRKRQPKIAFNLFLHWKKIGVSHQNRAIKKNATKLKRQQFSRLLLVVCFFSSIYDICSLSVSFHLYMIYRFGISNSHTYCSFSVFLFWIQLCYFACDSVHVIQEDGATTASTFFPFKASLGLPSTRQRSSYLLWVPRISLWS